MPRPQLAVVILNWKRPHDTVTCLRSLQAVDVPWQGIVVDNASGDESVAIIRAACPGVEVLVTERNLGFAGGNNVGLARALAGNFSYILLLNNDTTLEPDAPRLLIAAAEAHARAGILSPLIRYASDGRVWFAGSYRRRFLPGVSMPAYGRYRAFPPEPVRTDYATGCAMLLRREMLQQIGLLDDTYFMYWEDLDLCERARRAGWEVLLVPPAVVHHRVSASTGEESPQKWYYLGRYLPTFYRRYYRRPGLAMLAYAGWVAARETLKGHAGAVPPFLRGVKEGWRAY